MKNDIRGRYKFSMAVGKPRTYVERDSFGHRSHRAQPELEQKSRAGVWRTSTAMQASSILFCFLSLCFIRPAYAQSTFGSIRGTVQDSSGAALPGVSVTAHSLDDNA